MSAQAPTGERLAALEAQLAALEDPLGRLAARLAGVESRPAGGDSIALPGGAVAGGLLASQLGAPVMLQYRAGDNAETVEMLNVEEGAAFILYSSTELGEGNIATVKSPGVTWKRVQSVSGVAGHGLNLDMWIATGAPAAATYTITITMTGGSGETLPVWQVQEWMGVTGVASSAKISGAALPEAGTENAIAPALVLGAQNELVILLGSVSSPVTIQPNPKFPTWKTTGSFGNENSFHAWAVSMLNAAPSPVEFAFVTSVPGAGKLWSCIAAAFTVTPIGVASLNNLGVLKASQVPANLATVPGEWIIPAFKETLLEESGIPIAAWVSTSNKVLKLVKHGLTNGTPVELSSLVGGTGLEEGQKTAPVHEPRYVVAGATTNTIELQPFKGGESITWATEVTSVTITPIAVRFRVGTAAGTISLRGQLKVKAGKEVVAGAQIMTVEIKPPYTQTFAAAVGTEAKTAVTLMLTVNTAGEIFCGAKVNAGETIFLDGATYNVS